MRNNVSCKGQLSSIKSLLFYFFIAITTCYISPRCLTEKNLHINRIAIYK